MYEQRDILDIRLRYKHTDKERDKHTGKERDKHTGKERDKHTGKESDTEGTDRNVHDVK